MPDPRHELGRRAEDAAAVWLMACGWIIVARRWRCPEGELDLVAVDPDGVLVAVEVKLRRTTRSGDPLESIDRQRLRRLRAALGRFRATSCWQSGGLRIDLIAVRPAPDGLWRLARHPAIDGW